MDHAPQPERQLLGDSVGNDEAPSEAGRERRVRHLDWVLFVGLPLATPVIATAWYILAFAGLGAAGVILYLLTPLLCAVWSFRVCRRLAASSSILLAFLFAIELILIFLAFFLFTPHWD